NQWIIEAYTEHEYMDYFKKLQEKGEDIYLRVKITKESNAPAYFLTQIISIQDIGKHMNVVFKGTIIDKRENDIGNLLANLIEQGYEGEELLESFKAQVKNHQ